MTRLRRPAVLAAAASLAASLALTGVLTDSGAARAQSAAATTPSGWATTATLGVPMATPSLGLTAPSQPLQLMIALAPRNAAGLAAAVKTMYTPGQTTFHHYLTKAQILARYAPTEADVTSVVRYLHASGLTGVEVAANREAISATATVAQADEAFHTSISDFTLDGQRIYANTAPALVPARLGGLVSAVAGLHDVPLHLADVQHAAETTKTAKTAKTAKTGSRAAGRTSPHATPDGAVPSSLTGLYPGDLAKTYDATKTATGKKTTIAVLSEGVTAPVVTQLRLAEQKEHSPRVPLTIVPVGPQSPDAAGVDEFELDTQASTIFAGGVKHLYMYNVGALSDAQVAFGIETWAADDKATALSASLGGCEFYAYIDGTMAAIDSIMQQVALQGRTFMASSGDGGSTGCGAPASLGFPAGAPGDEWPAVGMFDLAVGGTSLVTDDQYQRTTEISWVGGGGGNSVDELPGFWTAQSDPGYTTAIATGESIGGRALPDVALNADGNVSPTEIYVDGQPEGIGGTSVSSPLMLGVWARLESAHHNLIGFAPTALYRQYDDVNPGTPAALGTYVPDPAPATVPGFYDVVAGVNGTYSSAPGWDYNTGIGVPDVAQLDKVLVNQVTASTHPGFRVTAKVVGAHAAEHTLRIRVQVTHPGAKAATGKLKVKVVNGHACTAKVTKNVGTCEVQTSTSKRHALQITYSGDKTYPAATAKKTVVTK